MNLTLGKYNFCMARKGILVCKPLNYQKQTKQNSNYKSLRHISIRHSCLKRHQDYVWLKNICVFSVYCIFQCISSSKIVDPLYLSYDLFFHSSILWLIYVFHVLNNFHIQIILNHIFYSIFTCFRKFVPMSIQTRPIISLVALFTLKMN